MSTVFGGLVLGALLIGSAPQETPRPDRDPQEAVVDDVIVTGRRLEEQSRAFVEAVASPTRDRGLARWHQPVCVGVANLRSRTAQPLIDHITGVALELGLQSGPPNCTPNILIVATDEPDAVAADFVTKWPRVFRTGGPGTNLGDAELRRFERSDAPVRWWHLSMPVNGQTGLRAVRLPGDIDIVATSSFGPGAGGFPQTGKALGSAPSNFITGSRLRDEIRDDLKSVLIVVDIEEVAGLSTVQLGDYLAMIGLAQIASPADTGAFDTVLNLFDQETVSGFTSWDRAYLRALYRADRTSRINPGSHGLSVARRVGDERRDDPSTERD